MNSLLAKNIHINKNKSQNNNVRNYIPLKIRKINSLRNEQKFIKPQNNIKNDIICEKIFLLNDKSPDNLNNNKFNNNKNAKNLIKVNRINLENKDKINDMNNFKKKLIFLQIWWKTLFQIIKIQKNIRGFLFRLKLLVFLDKSEKLYDISLKFCIHIKKYICKRPYILFINNIKHINMNCFLDKRKNKINLNPKNNIFKKIEKSNFKKIMKKEKNLNNSFNTKNKSKKLFKVKNQKIGKKDYIQEIFRDNKKNLNKTTLINNLNNLITIINNTNNIYNNIINENNKINNSLKDKNIDPKKFHNDRIFNKLNQKEISKINLYRYFIFWKLKNTKLIIIKKLKALNLLIKSLVKLFLKDAKNIEVVFFNDLKKFYSFIRLKFFFNSFCDKIFKRKYLYKLFKRHSKHNKKSKINKYNKNLKENKSLGINNKINKKINHKLFDISIDLKYNEMNNTLKEKLDNIKNSFFNWPNSLRNCKTNNIFVINKNFSKSSKNFYPLKYKRLKRNEKISNYSSEININKNNNYSKDNNDTSLNTNIIKSTINNNNLTSTNNYNDSLLENKNKHKFIYHRKKISKSLLKINNKNKNNNSCCSLKKEFNQENLIEEKEIFFKKINNNKYTILNKNIICLRKHINIRNKSAMNIKNDIQKTNSFYKKFGDIIHSAL